MRNQQIYEEASDWFARMRDGEDGAVVRGELMEWLRRSPEHVSAYLDIASVWLEVRNVDVDADLDLETRVAMAHADRNVAQLDSGAMKSTRRFPGYTRYAAMAASVLLVVGAGVIGWYQLLRDTYSTGLGEQRSIALSDGSTVDLNSESKVRVRFDGVRRDIELLRGQALFHVAKETARPFEVRTDVTAVRALGTVFDVYRKQSGAVVTVVEGSVLVEPVLKRVSQLGNTVLSKSGAMRLTAGKQVTVKPRSAEAPRPVNVASATAWTRRELVFEFTPLAEAAEEFNRYNERQLAVEGESLRDFKISAIFRSTDPASLVRYMRNMPGVRITESADHVLIAPAESRN